MRANLSLLGLYNYDPDLFDGFNYPTKWTAEDKETFRDALLLDTAELEIIYPDPGILNAAMRAWSRAMLPNWDKLYDTTQLVYNPIWNKDGTISETEKIKRDNSYENTRAGSGENHSTTSTNLDQVNTSTQQTETTTSNDTAGTNNQKDYVFGFNSNAASQSEQHETTSNENAVGSGKETITNNSKQINTGNSKDDGTTTTNETLNHAGNDAENREYERRETGNIGITTTQQMIKEEREVDKFNLMEYIINSFINKFCLLVY